MSDRLALHTLLLTIVGGLLCCSTATEQNFQVVLRGLRAHTPLERQLILKLADTSHDPNLQLNFIGAAQLAIRLQRQGTYSAPVSKARGPLATPSIIGRPGGSGRR